MEWEGFLGIAFFVLLGTLIACGMVVFLVGCADNPLTTDDQPTVTIENVEELTIESADDVDVDANITVEGDTTQEKSIGSSGVLSTFALQKSSP